MGTGPHIRSDFVQGQEVLYPICPSLVAQKQRYERLKITFDTTTMIGPIISYNRETGPTGSRSQVKLDLKSD